MQSCFQLGAELKDLRNPKQAEAAYRQSLALQDQLLRDHPQEPAYAANREHVLGGLGDVLREHRVPFVDLNHDEPVKLANLGRLTGLEFLYLARTVSAAA